MHHRKSLEQLVHPKRDRIPFEVCGQNAMRKPLTLKNNERIARRANFFSFSRWEETIAARPR